MAGFQLDTQLPLRMRIADFSTHRDSGATVRLQPVDAAENRKTRSLRDRIADLLEIRAPVLELGAPEFCVFNDMYAFDMQLRVGQPPQSAPLSATRGNKEA